MLVRQTPAAPAKQIRLIHASLVMGVLLFALVSHFVLRASAPDSGEFSPGLVRVLLAVALGLLALSLFFRRRVPRRSTDESADLYWTRATGAAMVTWAFIEGASLLSVFLYGQTGAPGAVGVAAVAVVLFLWLNPAYLERR